VLGSGTSARIAALLLFSIIQLPGIAIDEPGPRLKLITPISCSTPPSGSKPKLNAANETGEHATQVTNGSSVVSANPVNGAPNAACVIKPVVRKFICACVWANGMFPPKPALLVNAPKMPTPTGPGTEGRNWSLTM